MQSTSHRLWVGECGEVHKEGLASVLRRKPHLAVPGPFHSSLEQPAGLGGGGAFPVEMAKTDVRRGAQVRSQQLNMGKKALEESRRRKEGEG